MTTTPEKKESTGLDPKVAGLLCYLAGWITGLVFLLIEKEDKFVRFHAIQSIAVFGAYSVVFIILIIINMILVAADVPVLPTLITVVDFILWISAIVVWIVCMVKAYREEKFKLPVAGDFAEKHV